MFPLVFNKMKKNFGILFLVLTTLGVTGQNLVPNGNFELVDSCVTDTSLKYSEFWYNPNLGTADHYTFLMYGSGACIPYIGAVGCGNPNINFQGYQLPHMGLGYGGFGGGADNYYDTVSGGEFLATRLSDSLQANKKYCVSFWINMASTTKYASDGVGIAFRQDSIIGEASTVYSCPSPDVACPIIISDTVNWILVQDTFLANGGEKFMIIGNLRRPYLTNYLPIDTAGQGDGRFAYYYVDDISVIYCDLPQDTPVNPDFPEITFTPNPSNGEFLLKGNFPVNARIEVFDMLGQKVCYAEIPQGNQAFPVNLNLAEAVYTYRIESSDIVLKNGKLIIVKR